MIKYQQLRERGGNVKISRTCYYCEAEFEVSTKSIKNDDGREIENANFEKEYSKWGRWARVCDRMRGNSLRYKYPQPVRYFECPVCQERNYIKKERWGD